MLGRDRKAARDCRIRGEQEIPESEEPLRVTAEHRTSEKRNGLTVGRLTHQRRRTEIWLCPAGDEAERVRRGGSTVSVTQQFKDLVQGKTRMLSDKELAERDFEGFFAWLKEKGVANPYYYYPKEAWAAKAQAEQQRGNLIQVLKDPTTSKGVVLTAIMLWPRDQQEDLVAVLSPPPLADEPPSDVQSDVDRVEVPAS